MYVLFGGFKTPTPLTSPLYVLIVSSTGALGEFNTGGSGEFNTDSTATGGSATGGIS